MNLFTNPESKCKKNIDLLNILSEITKTNKPYILRGGLAIALYFKKIYRCHKDIDLYLDDKDFVFWNSFLSKKYQFKKSNIPKHCPEKMYDFCSAENHLGHIIFINDLTKKENIINQIYRQKKYDDPYLLNRYSKYIPITKQAQNIALSNFEEPIIEIQFEGENIKILNIKYLKEQKIFGIVYRNKSEDNDMKYYFDCVI
jgi:uncharacterized protein YkuJ